MITTIIPAYNEEIGIRSVVEEYLEYSDEIVIVDDGSTDRTPEISAELAAKYQPVQACEHEENKGKAEAIRTGVKNSSGDILVFTDADQTYPAEYVPALVDQIKSGADLALGSRMGSGVENIPLFNRIGNYILSSLVSFIGGIRIKDAQTGMRALQPMHFTEFDTGAATSLEFETRMTLRAAKMGYKIIEVPIEYRERTGESKLNPIRDGYRMLLSIVDILLTESTPVLQIVMVFGAVLITAGTYTGLVSLMNKLQTGIVQHAYYPLLTVFFFIIAFHAFAIMLMSEHIKNRIDRLEDKLEESEK